VTNHRVLIVDDEPLARERLEALLKRESGIEIVGQCGDGNEAIESIMANKPDIVFLDMEMPGCDGLNVVSELPPESRPAIVFVTAHDQFAVDAFAVNAVDYLLKPFDADRFRTALKRAIETVANRRRDGSGASAEGGTSRPAESERQPERLAVKSEGRVVFVKPVEIVWLEAADNYVVIHLADRERLTLRETLSSLEERLPTADFVRVNRSAIVRIDEIKELEPTFHGDYTVVMRNGTRLPLSRSLRGKIDKFISPEG
jgi:two-component system LytT family response regulator